MTMMEEHLFTAQTIIVDRRIQIKQTNAGFKAGAFTNVFSLSLSDYKGTADFFRDKRGECCTAYNPGH